MKVLNKIPESYSNKLSRNIDLGKIYFYLFLTELNKSQQTLINQYQHRFTLQGDVKNRGQSYSRKLLLM